MIPASFAEGLVRGVCSLTERADSIRCWMRLGDSVIVFDYLKLRARGRQGQLEKVSSVPGHRLTAQLRTVVGGWLLNSLPTLRRIQRWPMAGRISRSISVGIHPMGQVDLLPWKPLVGEIGAEA